MQKKTKLFIFANFLLLSLPAHSEESGFEDMSLEQLLNVKVSVVSRQAVNIKNSPGIITVITSEEIEKLGAKDLIGVLNQVPGFNFGLDTQGVVGLAFRGLWSQEGKILILIDDIELSENLYNNLEFGNHYPLSMIKKIEIIRGPGSVIYGGNAEMAVIKITTKTGNDLKGIQTLGVYGRTDKRESTANLGVNIGYASQKNDWSFNGNLGQSIRTDRDYTDSIGQTSSLKDATDLKPKFINLKFKNESLGSFQFMLDQYQMMDQTSFGQLISKPVEETFTALGASYKNNFNLASNWNVTPQISIKRDSPWKATDPILNTEPQALGEAYDVSITRMKGSLINSIFISDDINLTAGLEALNDEARDHIQLTTQKFNNYAIFTEITSNLSIASFAAGARYDWSPDYGDAFSPRFAILKQIQKTHFKLLYNQAFRTPSIQSINFSTPGSKILPEHLQSFEFEVGEELNANWYASLNLFKIKMKTPIIYNYSNGNNLYFNGDNTGTYGLESELKTKQNWGFASINYSYYRADSSTVPSYQVLGNTDTHLGIPNHKVSGQSSLSILPWGWSLNPSFVWIGDRYGYSYNSTAQMLSLQKYSACLTANLFFEKRDLFPHFNLGFGIYNLFNTDSNFIQPYNTPSTDPNTQVGHPPLSGLSREYAVRLGYEVKF